MEPNAQRKPQKNRPMIAVISSMLTVSIICPVRTEASNTPPMSAVKIDRIAANV